MRPTDEPRRFAFRHPVVRTAVYAAIPVGTRLQAHAAAATELARVGAPLPVRARHLAHAAVSGDVDAARTLEAAALAVRPQAPGVSADWLKAAHRADPTPNGVAATVLAETLLEAGRLHEALEAVESLDPQDDATLARSAVVGAAVERLLGRHDAAKRRLEGALEATGAAGPHAARLAGTWPWGPTSGATTPR